MLLQGREHAAMVHLSGPRLWRRPWVGVGLHRVGSARQEQLHQFDTAPPTGPPEWRALEQVVTQVEASTRIEDQGGESHALVGGGLRNPATLSRMVRPSWAPSVIRPRMFGSQRSRIKPTQTR